MLGAADGVYYAGEPRLSAERAPALRQCLAEDGARVVNAIVAAAAGGRAPRPDPALFALAMSASPRFAGAEVNAAALAALPRVARTAAQLKKFAAYVTAHRGWGRSLRSAFARWYLQVPVRELAQQMLKQRRRGRWSHADLLRLAHPKPESKAQRALFRWAVDGLTGSAFAELFDGDLKQVYGFEMAKQASAKHEIIELIEACQLTHEMVPERWLASADVWEALLDGMPYCAMLRNLGRLTAAGLIAPQGAATALVAARLVDQRRIARAKISPVTVLNTLLDFRQSHDIPAISAGLETALYASLANVPPGGRRFGVACDGAAPVASAILAMLAARGEDSATMRLDTVMAAVQSARPHLDSYAGVEALVVVTGESGWTGPVRPEGLPLVIVAPNATGPSPTYADDPSVLQVVGFDATVPRAIAGFLR
jgi:60 kDa SS-A/Ro ribonucleoprotein